VLQSSVPDLNLGFLAIQQDANGYLGAYLVTNRWGRPLEFRLSTRVQPNGIQQILYGATLQPYICADLIARTLVEKTSTAAECILTDCEAVLDLRPHVRVPVVWLAPCEDPVAEDLAEEGAVVLPARDNQGPVVRHPRFPDDCAAVKEMVRHLQGLELAEPFARIREALGEARKLGVTNRG
jgi:hypothetical protein